MADDTYNGWTNKPAWLVRLWIDNDQGEQEYWLSEAPTMSQGALADNLRETFEARSDDYLMGDSSMYADLMSWALAMVNWDEVAKALIEDAAEVVA